MIHSEKSDWKWIGAQVGMGAVKRAKGAIAW